jgi:thymidylate synthase ThyX
MLRFASAPPIVRLTKAFATPYRNVVATAKTCYSSKGIVSDDQVGEAEKFTPLVQSIYEAGHHTTFQHAHFQFSLENVSRQFIWSFLHAHPFYNSEQVSQRYVAVKPDTVAVPELPPDQAAIYRSALDLAFTAYRDLCTQLEGPVRNEFFRRFNRSERMAKAHDRAISRKAQEAARYVLPVATFAYLYHTVSGITLLRYYRLARQQDTPSEQMIVLQQMVDELLRFDENYSITLQEPLAEEALPERLWLHNDAARAARFAEAFDAELGPLTSRLVGHTANGDALVAEAVREMLALLPGDLSDEQAIRLAADPATNSLLGESLNLTTLHKLSRALVHPHFTFRKKLSHAADSQDQRHRMTPGSRPYLSAHLTGSPDYITPEVIRTDEACHARYRDTMDQLWEHINRLRALGAEPEVLAYLLPNAVSVRFSESADFLNLRHKHQMRLCYNAQEEIWKAAVEEATQIRTVLPQLGRYLLPPCGVRALARQKPICPEGPRFCGERVWKMDLSEYRRVI